MLLRISTAVLILQSSILAAPQINRSVTGERSYCDKNPCKNGATCQMQPNSLKFYCECADGWNGKLCDIPNPTLKCGTSSIEVLLDKRMLTQNGNMESKANLISFNSSDDPKCQAADVGDYYKLTIGAPFSDHCGTVASRANGDSGDYVFSNSVFWKKVLDGKDGEAAIQRRINLVSFNCKYEDEYLLQMVPLKPAESVIEEKTSKGNFKVDMTLWKNSDYEKDITSQYSANPIIKVEDEVCVKMSLDNGNNQKAIGMQGLVLTATDCWASGVSNPSEEQKHYILEKKCRAGEDYSTKIQENGVGNDVKFCFKVYKWKDQMDSVYLQCRLSVCDDGIKINGNSQCICPPSTFRQNDWYYPNYYQSILDSQKTWTDYGDTYYYTYDYGYADNTNGNAADLFTDTSFQMPNVQNTQNQQQNGRTQSTGMANDFFNIGNDFYSLNAGYGGNYGMFYDTNDNNNPPKFYYDYISPVQTGKRRRRKRRSAETKTKTETPSAFVETDETVDKSKTLPKKMENPFQQNPSEIETEMKQKSQHRKRLEIKNLFKKDEDNNPILPKGLKIDPQSDKFEVGYGPIHVIDRLDPELVIDNLAQMAEVEINEILNEEDWLSFETSESANNVVLLAVGGSLILALIVLGIVVGVYVQFKNKLDEKNSKAMKDQQKVKDFYNGVLKGNGENNGNTFVRMEE